MSLPSFFPHRIMVVDDDPFVGTVVSGVLTEAGVAEVKVCASGETAVAEAPDFRPELILLDFMMPGMDGRATWMALDACLSPPPPAIFLTARDDANFRAEIAGFQAIHPAIVGVLAKPFNPAALADEIGRILGQAKANGGDRNAPRAPAAKVRRLAAVADAFRRSLPATTGRLTDSWARVREAGWARDAAEAVLSDAHSLAGSAGLFDLGALGGAAHDAERLLLNALKLDRAPTASEMRALANAVTALIAACRSASTA